MNVENYLSCVGINKSMVIERIKPYQGSCITYYTKDDTKALIDAGYLIKEPVDIILITHAHVDHIMYLYELKETNGCKVFCGWKEKEDIETLSEKTLIDWADKEILPVKIDRGLKEGDRIELGEIVLEVIETPGHTDGSVCYYDREHKILFSGDTWFGYTTGRWDLPSGNYNELMKSLEKIKKLEIEYLFPGH